MSAATPRRTAPIHIGRPAPTDAGDCWELVCATGVLDANSRYAYALWFRDFAATSVVAREGGRVVGMITGYRRPEEPETLVVWQVAVDREARGQGLAGRMLDALAGQAATTGLAPRHLETTITADNAGSIALFTGFARRHGATVTTTDFFGPAELGPGHEPEQLYRISPLDRRDDQTGDNGGS